MRKVVAGSILAVAAGLAGGLLLSGTPDAAQAQTRRVAAGPAHICSPGAKPIYSCRMGRQIVSLCSQDGSLSYHYGPSAAARELTIPAGANGENIHYGIVVGQGGGGQQEHFRFTNGDTQYVVYRGTDGRLASRPGRSYSGMAVMQGSRTLSRRSCIAPTVNADWGAHSGTVRQEPEDSQYDGWF